MAKTFSPWQPEQTNLLPPSPSEWLSDDHQVYFLLDLVDELNLAEILTPAPSKDPRGEKGFDPRMMKMLLLYAYCVGIVSSRKIERALAHRHAPCAEMGFDRLKDLLAQLVLLKQVPEGQDRGLIGNPVFDQIDAGKAAHGGYLDQGLFYGGITE